MAIDKDRARTIAEEFVRTRVQPRIRFEVVLVEGIEYRHCWVFGYNSRRFAETGDFRHALAGNGPLIVNKRTGLVREGVSATPVEEQLDEA
jgi:hypothetical protein